MKICYIANASYVHTRRWTRYFADSGIIGSKQFVRQFYGVFKGHFSSKHEKKPKAITGLGRTFSLKRLYGEG